MKQTIAQRLVEIFRDNDRPNDYFKLPEYRREIAPHVVGKGKWHSDACMTSAGSTWFWNFADESAAAYVWKGHRILVRGQFLEEFSAYGCPENWKNDSSDYPIIRQASDIPMAPNFRNKKIERRGNFDEQVLYQSAWQMKNEERDLGDRLHRLCETHKDLLEKGAYNKRTLKALVGLHVSIRAYLSGYKMIQGIAGHLVEKNALRGNALLVSQYLEKWSAQICDQCKKLDELMLYLSVSIEASPAEMVLPRITKAYSVIRRFHKNFGENNIKIGDMVNDGSYWLLIVFSKHDWRREKKLPPWKGKII